MISQYTILKLIELTRKDLYNRGINDEKALLSLMEEVGELSTAIAVENGIKQRELEEPAYSEAVDVIIMGLVLYNLTGGMLVNIDSLILAKLGKWENNNG